MLTDTVSTGTNATTRTPGLALDWYATCRLIMLPSACHTSRFLLLLSSHWGNPITVFRLSKVYQKPLDHDSGGLLWVTFWVAFCFFTITQKIMLQDSSIRGKSLGIME
jgi:hypothetical protein